MAKSKPIGVRFDEDVLALIQKEQNLSSPQRVLNYLMESYLKSNSLVPKQEVNIKHKKVVVKKNEALESPENDDYDFSQVLFFKIEDFTKYPKSDKPLEYLEAKKWNSLKLKSDEKIRELWKQYKNK